MDQEGQVVITWFGPGFSRLHPLLQRLHRHGARLAGPVAITYGRWVGGWLGRRVARRMGIASGSTQSMLAVHIRSSPEALYWTRTFGGGVATTSVFTPVGAWPDGHWVEQAGPVSLQLQVQSTDGAWRWVPMGTKLWGLPLPRWLSPRVDAGKYVKDDMYHFSVRVSHPLLGMLLSYSGTLAPDTQSV